MLRLWFVMSICTVYFRVYAEARFVMSICTVYFRVYAEARFVMSICTVYFRVYAEALVCNVYMYCVFQGIC